MSRDGERAASDEVVTRKEMGYVNLCPAWNPVGLAHEPLATPVADTPQCHGLPGGSQHVRRFQNEVLPLLFLPTSRLTRPRSRN